MGIVGKIKWIWNSIVSLSLALVLIDAGSKAFFLFDLIDFIAVGNIFVLRVIYGIASVFGILGLIAWFFIFILNQNPKE